jgi:hypothetical protein
MSVLQHLQDVQYLSKKFIHLLTCSYPPTKAKWEESLNVFEKCLKVIKMPTQIIHAFIVCMVELSGYCSIDWSSCGRFTDGCRHIDNAAFSEQFHIIGWYNGCLGRIGNMWALADMAYNEELNEQYMTYQ